MKCTYSERWNCCPSQ